MTFNLVCSATQTVEAQNQQSIGGIDDGIENGLKLIVVKLVILILVVVRN